MAIQKNIQKIMSEEKKSRGKQPKPGIPFKKQTPQQKAFLALIRALDSYGYRESRYTATKFITVDAIRHMNMKLLAKVLYFIQQYDIIDKYNILESSGAVSSNILDITKLKDLNTTNIHNINISIFENEPTISTETQHKNDVDFIRYFIFAIQVLRSNEITPDNNDEINSLLLSLESGLS